MPTYEVHPRWKLPERRRKGKAARDAQELRETRRALLERSQGRCEPGFVLGCTGVGTTAHHIKRRSQGGGNDARNLLWTCAVCHAAIHNFPAMAAEAGLLAPSWA